MGRGRDVISSFLVSFPLSDYFVGPFKATLYSRYNTLPCVFDCSDCSFYTILLQKHIFQWRGWAWLNVILIWKLLINYDSITRPAFIHPTTVEWRHISSLYAFLYGQIWLLRVVYIKKIWHMYSSCFYCSPTSGTLASKADDELKLYQQHVIELQWRHARLVLFSYVITSCICSIIYYYYYYFN